MMKKNLFTIKNKHIDKMKNIYDDSNEKLQ